MRLTNHRSVSEALLGTLFVFHRNAAVVFLFCLAKVVERVAAAIAHGDASLFGALMDLFDELLAAVLGQLRQGQSNDLPSLLGLMPRSDFWIAFSMTPASGSQGCTRTMRGSGALTLATPLTASAYRSSRPGCGRAARAWPPGTDRLQVLAQNFDGSGHLVLGGLQDVIKHGQPQHVSCSHRMLADGATARQYPVRMGAPDG